MRANLSLLGIEARRSLALWLVPFFAALMSYTAIGELPRGVWLWPHTSVAIQDSLVLVGPFAAGLSAWVAARNRRRNIEELLITTPFSAAIRDLTTWGATAAWICLGYVLVTAALFLSTFSGATWGAPSAGPVVAGTFALCMHSAVGYAIGYLLPRLFTALFVAVLDYLIQGFAGYFWGSYLSPVATPFPDAFYGVFPDVSALQTLWFASASAAALAFVALKATEKSAVALLSVAAVLVLAAGTAVLVARTNPPLSPERAGISLPSYEPVCEERALTVCVHPAYEGLLSEAATTIDQMTTPLIGVAGGPIRASQVPNQPVRLREDGTLEFYIYDGSSLNDQLQVELAYALVQGGSSSDRGAELTRVQTVIAASLTQPASTSDVSNLFPGLADETTSEAFDRFSRLSTEEQRGWLKKNFSEVRNGGLSLEDLP